MYEWLKAAHIVSLIAWMAALFYLPRLFVYHADAEKGSRQSETFKVMERRLLKAIASPAMGATWIFGLALAWQGAIVFAAVWLATAAITRYSSLSALLATLAVPVMSSINAR